MKYTHSQVEVHSWSHNIDGSHWLCDTNCHMPVVCCWPTWNAYALWWTNIDMAEAWAMNGNKQNKIKQNKKKIGTENMETLCCRRRSILANLIYPKNVSHITYANIYRSHRNVGCDLKIAPKIKFWSAHTTHTHTQNHLWRTRRYAIREFVVAGLMKHWSLSAIRRAVHTHNIYVASNVCICII